MAKIDLNLVLIFDAVMREQSITGAARQLAMTQPSVSKAVTRMRHIWKDPLFVKNGRGIQPTPYAEELWQQIENPLQSIQAAIAPDNFDPSLTRTQFRIAMTDGNSSIFWPMLREVVEKRAQAIDLYAVPYKQNGEELLLAAEADVVLDYYQGKHPNIISRPLYHNHFICLLRPEHPLANRDITLEEFCQAQHLLVSLSGDPVGIVDNALAQIGRSRRVAMTVHSFASAIELIKTSNLLCLMPYSVAHRYQDQLLLKRPPLSVPPVEISLAWHKRNERKQSLRWLIKEIETLITTQPDVFHWI